MPSAVKTRRTDLDILRILASFLVCFNHSEGFHAFLNQQADGSVMSWIHVFLSVWTVLDIPLFFMLSGALLLGRQESYKDLFSKRIARFLVLILAATTLMYLVKMPQERSLSHFFYTLLRGDIANSYWYLYAYLSFLLVLPFLRMIAKELRFADAVFLVVLRLVFATLLPILNYWLGYWGIAPLDLSDNLQFLLGMDVLFYPLVGYYLAQKLPFFKVTPRHVLACAAVFLGGSLISALMTYAQGLHSQFSQRYLGIFNFTSAMCLFLLVRYGTERVTFPGWVSSLLASVSSMTLGIYLLEPVVTHYLYMPFYDRIYWVPIVSTRYSFLWCLLVMGFGCAATWLLRKIPGVKHYL